MRISLLFSLFLGLLALLAISKRAPFDGVSSEPVAASLAQQVEVVVPKPTVAAPVSPIELPQTKQPLQVAALAPPPRQRAPQQQGRMYKWRDSRGSIRYQSDPPPSNVQAQIIPFTREVAKSGDDAQSRALVLRATSSGPAETWPVAPTSNLKGALSGALSVYTPEGFDALIQRVEDIAVKLNDRNQIIQSLERQL